MNAELLGPKQCEEAAQSLMHYAANLEMAYKLTRDLCHTAPDAIRAEMDAMDAMDDHAKTLCRAMRAIAMRIDRSALVKFNPEMGAE